MCCFLAYRGDPILLEDFVTAPSHSLIHQSLHEAEGKTETNGDGFGVGWYGERPTPRPLPRRPPRLVRREPPQQRRSKTAPFGWRHRFAGLKSGAFRIG